MSHEPDTAEAVRIVVGIDGSTHSDQALRWARHLAGPLSALVEAVCVWNFLPGYGLASPATDWDPEAEARQTLDEALARVIGEAAPAEVSPVLRRGNIAQQLIKAGEGAAMIVVGSRGHGGFAGLLLGSVSAAVAEHAVCPVLVVHSDNTPPPRA